MSTNKTPTWCSISPSFNNTQSPQFNTIIEIITIYNVIINIHIVKNIKERGRMCVGILISMIILSTISATINSMDNKNGNSQKNHTKQYHLYPSTIPDNKLPPLHKAAKNNDWKKIIYLYKHHTDLDMLNEYRQTALHLAAAFNCIEAAITLLQRKALPNSRCTLGYTALHVAAVLGHTDMVELLLNFGAHPNEPSNLNDTPMMLAALYGHAKVVHLLSQAIQDEQQLATCICTSRSTSAPEFSHNEHLNEAPSSLSAPEALLLDSITTTSG